MKVWIYFARAPRRVVSISRKRYYSKLKRQMIALKLALSQEKAETREMLSVYKKYTKNKATPEELLEANKQFIDVLKGLGLGVFALLPFAPITIPILLKIGKMVGVDILPSSFIRDKKK